MAVKAKKGGRRKGSSNKAGFYFLNTTTRKGWYTTEGTKIVQLLDPDDCHIKDKSAVASAREAHARYATSRQERERLGDTGPQMLVGEICRQYLATIKTTNTLRKRKAFLFDFITGLPARFANNGQEPKPTDRIHKGYGNMTAAQIIVKDIHDWCTAHDGWNDGGGKRSGIQAVKRAFRWAKEMGLIKTNPLDGLKNKASNRRVTFITDEQEKALLSLARQEVALAIKVCIRTGARYGCEFCALEARHIVETDRGQMWVFPVTEAKTRKKERTILVPDEIAAIVRQQMKHHGGWVFRRADGKPWNVENLKECFARVREAAKRKGTKFDDEVSMYSCRHTYAKRTLGGYWTGGVCASIEQLAGLMGNSRQVAWDTYGQWCGAYKEPLWAALGK